ncbi:sulfate ABC transporter substrate-binding protein [Clostridium chromiireducens]|uniref:Sulfate-binding protein n=1 Tax=Clostridium chromiireducens TaxID=225345 RepID=A0A1V4IMU8_9CLOT|nr:sulfate ABC transporter substrate-binding protein [Clostridium chromiireducens]OPJ61226.1 sulfate-binding protein precursor [Clostridium chromiireducens]RII36097.1 sulfate ABC transporter substrate-binding protein [Clostridium chromiireducens]
MKKSRILSLMLSAAIVIGVFAGCGRQEASNGIKPVELLNVSYDPTRELYTKYNESFVKYWKEKTGQDVTIDQSHAGSGSQAQAVIGGLDADIVTLALGYDIDAISKSGLIDNDWQSRFKENSAPYTSTIVFLVRKGNPQNIRDWDDLTRDGISIVTPNPKTSGGARWNYLAAWAYASKKYNGDEKSIKDFMSKLYSNVVVLDSGARGATTSFVRRGLGDVLIAWENEAMLSLQQLGKDNYEVVTPSLSILTEPSVAVVNKVTDRRGTKDVAEAYLGYLYTKEGQELVAENYFRPRDKEVAEKYKDIFPKLDLVTIDDPLFGGWKKAQSTHFSDGGTFDQIYIPKG